MASERPTSSDDEWGLAAAAPLAGSGSPSSDGVSEWADAVRAAPHVETEPGASSSDEWGALALPLSDQPPSPAAVAAMSPQSPPTPRVVGKRKRGRPSRGDQLLERAVRSRPAEASSAPSSNAAVGVAHTDHVTQQLKRHKGRGAPIIGASILARLRTPTAPGEPHPLLAIVTAANERERGPSDAVDQETLELAQTMLGPLPVRMLSQVAVAEKFSTTRKRLLPRQRSVFASAFIAPRAARWNLEKQLRQLAPRVECVAYMDLARYDETPMKVKSAGASSTAVGLPSAPARDGVDRAIAPTSSQTAWSPQMGESAVTLSAAAKILQSEAGYTMVMKVGGELWLLVGSTLCNLQLLESCTARCLMASQAALSSITPFCADFALRLRISVTDKHSANLLCGRTLATDLGAVFFGLAPELRRPCRLPHPRAGLHPRRERHHRRSATRAQLVRWDHDALVSEGPAVGDPPSRWRQVAPRFFVAESP